MNSMVLDLQQEAYSSQMHIFTLLRRAYVVAQNLKQKVLKNGRAMN